MRIICHHGLGAFGKHFIANRPSMHVDTTGVSAGVMRIASAKGSAFAIGSQGL